MESGMCGTFWSDAVKAGCWIEKWNQTTNRNGNWMASGAIFSRSSKATTAS
jgi:hypothetical protein